MRNSVKAWKKIEIIEQRKTAINEKINKQNLHI